MKLSRLIGLDCQSQGQSAHLMSLVVSQHDPLRRRDIEPPNTFDKFIPAIAHDFMFQVDTFGPLF